MRRIEILVTADGQTQVQTQGFSGASCQDATRLLEQALGQKHAEEHTAEYFAAVPAAPQVQWEGQCRPPQR